jgi:hypothetical protein
MNNEPLTDDEKVILERAGWQFLSDDYIYIPDDYDGSMAYGVSNIRQILDRINENLWNES